MSLFNKDYQNRSGLKCNIVYTDYINDIPIGNYLSGGGGDNITCLTLSGLIVTSNKIYCNYINNILFSSIITTQFNTQSFSYNSNNNFTTINGPFNTNSPIYCTNNIYCNENHSSVIWASYINNVSLTNFDKIQYLDVNSSLATTQYNVQSLGYNEFNNTLYMLNDTKLNITADLITTSINGILTNKYVTQSPDGFTTINTIKSNSIVLDNNTNGILWANYGSQIYDDGNLQIVTDDTMILRIGTTWTNVIQLLDTFIYNTLNVSDNIKLINTNGLTFKSSTNTTLLTIDNMGNITTTGTINDIIINNIITTNNIKTLSNKTLQNPSINDGIYTGQQTFSNAPIMSGASITSSSIPDTALTSNIAKLNGTNTWSAKQTFTVAPAMSGSSITGTIPDTALTSNVALKNGTNTWSAKQTFSIAPAMSGSSITGTIPDTALSSNVALKNGNNTFSGNTTLSNIDSLQFIFNMSTGTTSYSTSRRGFAGGIKVINISFQHYCTVAGTFSFNLYLRDTNNVDLQTVVSRKYTISTINVHQSFSFNYITQNIPTQSSGFYVSVSMVPVSTAVFAADSNMDSFTGIIYNLANTIN